MSPFLVTYIAHFNRIEHVSQRFHVLYNCAYNKNATRTAFRSSVVRNDIKVADILTIFF